MRRVPELPEVEVTRRRLAPLLVGRRVAEVRTSRPSYFFLTPPRALARALRGRVVTELRRHGKYLFADLDDGRTVLLHLGMTGQLFSSAAASPRLVASTSRAVRAADRPKEFVPDQHTHVTFEFEDGGPVVYFRDVRKFGKVLLLAPGASDARVDKLGVDALEATGADLRAAAARRKTPIKTLLLDQAVLAGVGNIYADEALFLASVKPTRPAQRVKADECAAIVAAAQRVMQRSIETGGSSISDYVTPDGSDGGYQNERQVYARTGEPCPTCATPIRRTVIATRASHWCPRCQR